MGVCLIIRSGGGTDTSGATATAARVLSGYTCYVNDVKITGTMANQGTKTASLNAGGSYTIPAGYHSGSGKVTANALSGQTSGTVGAAHILSGYNAWVNGTNTWGNMPNRGNISHSLPANGSYTIPAGWHAGGGVVNQSLAFHWGGTYTPNTANQVICWANWYAAGNIVIVGSSALTAGNIRNGVWIFGVLGTWTGPISDTPSFGDYFSPIIDTNRHYRREDYSVYDSDDLCSVIRFSGTVDQHIATSKNMYGVGFRRLWIEANFNYVSWISSTTNNYASAVITGKRDNGLKIVKHTKAGFSLTTTSTKNTWVFLNVYIRDGDAWYGTPNVEINMPALSSWDHNWDRDWFQLLKWACWFSKS